MGPAKGPKEASKTNNHTPPRKTPPRNKNQEQTKKPEDVIIPEDISFREVFSDLFSGLFKENEDAPSSKQGSHLRYHLNLTKDEAVKGCEKKIHFVRQRGSREDVAKLAVTVPSGVKENQKLRLAGEGDAPGTKKAGDLFVIISINEDIPDIFRIEGAHLHLEVPISFIEACLGSDIPVPTLSGQVLLKVPPRHQFGESA